MSDQRENNVIAVIGGTGPMGMGLAYRWARGGYSVIIGSRTHDRAVSAAAELLKRVPGAKVSGLENSAAAAAANICALTVPYAHHQATLAAIRDGLNDKILIDATVPLRPPKVGRVQLPETGSAAVEAQTFLGERVSVVRHFKTWAPITSLATGLSIAMCSLAATPWRREKLYCNWCEQLACGVGTLVPWPTLPQRKH